MDKVWIDKARYDNAEKMYYEWLCNVTKPNNCSFLVSEIAKAREHIQTSLEKIDDITIDASSSLEILSRIAILEAENKEIRNLVSGFAQSYHDILQRLSFIENYLNVSSNRQNNDVNFGALKSKMKYPEK
ncbi:probable elongation factor 1-delta isoform X1 [Drosophila novamexicana]|uniref:probable elongation factor 1-delta isoform X1 n=1 Tax=Drosophila novamexicana TaxID=47314 RepID=UPI0011E5E56B|nr:probable elongation factor 1-delta isoform X1 [Drosophila novamexicana]